MTPDQLRDELLAAIQERQFELWFQPIVELKTGHVVAQEALLRWRFNGRVRYPNFFLPFARHMKLESQICKIVMGLACEAVAGWNTGAVALNLEPTTINMPTFPEILERTILEQGINSHRIWCEVVEVVEADLDLLVFKLHHLRKSHRIAIDDYGSGYSNLAALAAWPIDALKIDRSLVSGILHDRRFGICVSYTIKMAHALGLAVTAEGIETEGQRAWLLAHGCDYGQGYLFGKPSEIPLWKV